MILRNGMFRLSMEFVVYTTRRISGGNTKNGVTYSQARRHACTMLGYLAPQGPSAKAAVPVANPMHDAGLHGCLGIGRADGLGQALQAVDHRDQDVLAAAGFEFVKDLEPEFGPLGLLDPQAQHVTLAVSLMPKAKYTALLLTRPPSRTFTRSASKNTTGYITSSGRLCQASAWAITWSVTELMNSGETSVP
jgi:hypothetical protein